MTTSTIRLAHSSGQFSDTEKQQTRDANRLADLMVEKQWVSLGGTEAGSQSVLAPVFRDIDRSHGLRFRKGKTGDVWFMHRLDWFEGEVETEWYKVIDGVGGKFADRGILRVTGYSPIAGSEWTDTVSHWLTHGRPAPAKGQDPFMVNGNARLAKKLGEIGREFGRGGKIVTYRGDQNIPESMGLLLDSGFTSVAQEVHKVENTGHGAIDCIATWDKDNRVSAVDFQVYTDKEEHLETDHFLIDCVLGVRKRAKHG